MGILKSVKSLSFLFLVVTASPAMTSGGLSAIALQPATVISVGDGDTIRVRTSLGETQTIRLACIDSAEMAQAPHGEQARQRLQLIIPVGTPVNIQAQTTDRYGRTVAEVFKNNLNVNLAMVQEGRAVAYRQYLSQCEGDRYLSAEASAKSRRLAFWNQAEPIMPWDFRRGVRATVQTPVQPIPQAKLNCHPSYPTVCIPPAPPDLDCADIPYRRFKVIGADPHRFDGDGRRPVETIAMALGAKASE